MDTLSIRARGCPTQRSTQGKEAPWGKAAVPQKNCAISIDISSFCYININRKYNVQQSYPHLSAKKRAHPILLIPKHKK